MEPIWMQDGWYRGASNQQGIEHLRLRYLVAAKQLQIVTHSGLEDQHHRQETPLHFIIESCVERQAELRPERRVIVSSSRFKFG